MHYCSISSGQRCHPRTVDCHQRFDLFKKDMMDVRPSVRFPMSYNDFAVNDTARLPDIAK